jgi:hypothetical protein
MPAVSAVFIGAKLRRMGEHLITVASIIFVVAVPAAFGLVVWWLDA